MKINKKNYRIEIMPYKKGGYTGYLQVANWFKSCHAKTELDAKRKLLRELVKEANKYQQAFLHLDS